MTYTTAPGVVLPRRAGHTETTQYPALSASMIRKGDRILGVTAYPRQHAMDLLLFDVERDEVTEGEEYFPVGTVARGTNKTWGQNRDHFIRLEDGTWVGPDGKNRTPGEDETRTDDVIRGPRRQYTIVYIPND